MAVNAFSQYYLLEMFRTVEDVANGVGVRHTLPLDGVALHSSVPPEYWCVTRDDLRRLKTLVSVAVRDGHIVPTNLDPFDPEDHQIGPCIHTVNIQFIKPTTALVGKCSWALMCHPGGGKCDLFVTHAWQEGLFEFIDKVLHSWPKGAVFAYCCMLSNPQNLDIAGMISSPSDSPFAKALRSAPHMLVVPNHKKSIYTRVWCAYEAFLAYSWGKMIFTASLQKFWRQLIISVWIGIVGLCVGKAIAYLSTRLALYLYNLTPSLMIIIAVVSAFSGPSTRARVVNYVGMLLVGLLCGVDSVTGSNDNDVHDGITEIHDALPAFRLLMAAFFLVAEADRMWAARALIEADELTRGYTGQLQNAESSNEEDRRAILLEIDSSGCRYAVDEAVDVLIFAGMSSPSLQLAARMGVNVKSTGRCKRSVALIAWGHWFLGPAQDLLEMLEEDAARETFWAALITLLEGGVCLSVVFWQTMDRRTFTSLVVLKVFFLVYMLPDMVYHLIDFFGIVIYFLVGSYPPVDLQMLDQIRCMSMFTDACVLGPITVLLSAIGPGNLACVPLIGPHLAQYILGSHCFASGYAFLTRYCCWCQRRREEAPSELQLVENSAAVESSRV